MQILTKNLGMSFQNGEREVKVFSDLNLNIASGSSVAILGESGVGKSTLLNLLAGLEKPVDGEIVLGDTSFSSLFRSKKKLVSFRAKNIGIVFQFHQLLEEFDARENVAFPLFLQGGSRDKALKRADELLERVGLADRLTHRPGMLSGGQQQRVAIARALVANPKVILADEPTGNLDWKTGGSILDVLLELQREEGATLVVVTHSERLASELERQVIMTSEGIKE